MDNKFLFAKVRIDGRSIWWFEVNGVYLVNTGGGRWEIDASRHEILETEWAEDFIDLDWSNTVFDDPTSSEGWLSPTGLFFGCSYGSHDMAAWYMLKRDPGDLRKSGYGRVHAKNTFTGRPFVVFDCDVQPTEEQKKWMIERKMLISEFF